MAEQGESYVPVIDQLSMPEVIGVNDEFELRKVTEQDAVYAWMLYQDEAIINETLLAPHAQTLRNCSTLVSQWLDDWEDQRSFTYFLESRANPGSVVGVVEAYMDTDTVNRKVDFTVAIDEDFRGEGLAGDALIALEPVIDEHLDIHSFTLHIRRQNTASQRAAAKVGYQRLSKSGGMVALGKVLESEQ